jgi:hypothetical protein
MKSKTLLMLSFSGLMSSAMVHGAVFNFTSVEGYNLGALSGQQGWMAGDPGTGPDPFANVVAGGLSYSSGAIQHNGGDQGLSLLGGGNGRVSIALPSTYAPGSTVYFSFLFNHSSGDNFLWFGLSDRADSDNGSISALSQNQNVGPGGSQVATPRLRSRVRDDAGGQNQANADYTASPVFDGWGLMQPGETQLIVGEIFFGGFTQNSTIRVWLNPTSMTQGENPNFFDNGGRVMNIGSLDTLWIRKGGTEGEAFVDHIMLGDSWDAVVIPEPSTYAALFGLLALGLIAWRRRR